MTSIGDFAIGIGMSLISGIGFGSMFVPVKKYDLRDGVFVQWVQCSTIMFCSLFVFIIRGFPQFHFLAAFAGAFWAFGNLLTVPIVNSLGAGLGILIWGSVQTIVGWGTGRFGLFGLDAEVPKNDTLAFVGVFLTMASGLGFVMVKANDQSSVRPQQLKESESDSSNEPSLTKVQEIEMNTVNHAEAAPVEETTPRSSAIKAKIIPIAITLVAGLIFGFMMTPVTYVQTKYPGASPNGLDYAMAYCVGIYFTSTGSFIVYAIWKRGKPYMPMELFLPSVGYGTLWAIAMFAWMVGSQKLSQSIAFPINTRLPGIVASLWGVFYFHEVSGTRNLLILAGSIVVAVVGVTCVGLANIL